MMSAWRSLRWHPYHVICKSFSWLDNDDRIIMMLLRRQCIGWETKYINVYEKNLTFDISINNGRHWDVMRWRPSAATLTGNSDVISSQLLMLVITPWHCKVKMRVRSLEILCSTKQHKVLYVDHGQYDMCRSHKSFGLPRLYYTA